MARPNKKMMETEPTTRGFKVYDCLTAMVVLLCVACSTPGGPRPATGNIDAAKTIEEPNDTGSTNPDIDAAKETVKNYWIATNSSYEDMYDLFSSSYKEVLSELDGITNAEDFRESIPPTERIWPKQNFQSARLDGDLDIPHIQIIVLAEWQEKGYAGVMTFFFDLVKEGDEWKITDIMF
jgi:hypothetical protein